ncbi:hypothetical protein LUZ60_017738 [Juncus effusus]|nr:hypothetical protein LUZ60_017738 [Juncus effusus]
MAKAGIIEEFVTPLIKHLERAEKQIVNLKSGDDKIKKKFEEINKMIKDKKAILTKRKEWEGNIIEKFGVVEQHIDNILEDKECNINGALEHILTALKEMVEKETTTEEPGEDKAQIPKYERGESSKTSATELEDSMPFVAKIIETLDPQFKNCLYCLSMFPEKSVIKRRLLVYWWIGLELVRAEWNNTAEQVGGRFFNDLVDKGILISHKTREHNKVVDQCKVQPIIHKKLISSARRKGFILEEINDNFLKVCTIRGNELDVGSILNVNQMYLKSDVIRKSDIKNMAVMQVGQWKCVDCHHIEADKTDFLNEPVPNLKYLSLQNISRIPELPKPIGNSTSLMILDVRACHNLEKLPPKIKSWKNLTHLDVSMCYLLDHIPKGIGSLRNLEVFKGFVIGSSGNKKWCRLSDISGLSKLRKLSINIGRGSNVDDEDSSSLKHLRNLKSLTMTWGLDLEENKPVDQEQESKTMVPENPPLEQQEKTPIIIAPVNIFPPENLEKLDLICFPNAESPQWMTPTGLNKLKRLYIRGGNLAIVSNNNNLQGAWKVEILRLRFLKNFKIGWNDLHGIFPEVECIELLECDKITDFPLTDQGFWFKAKQEASPGNNSADETFIQ